LLLQPFQLVIATAPSKEEFLTIQLKEKKKKQLYL
jgi:hypothetical protein